jgi:hypothetical protein
MPYGICGCEIIVLTLVRCKRTHPVMLSNMAAHYSQPKGFVGRNICYLIYWNEVCYGSIVAGSSTMNPPGRHEFLGTIKEQINNIINNIFFHAEKVNGIYPTRNFLQKVLKKFVVQSSIDWERKYGDEVLGFESLVELPRTGDIYLRSGWSYTGTTKGHTCKRVSGVDNTEKYSGKRVWDRRGLRPKLVFCLLC